MVAEPLAPGARTGQLLDSPVDGSHHHRFMIKFDTGQALGGTWATTDTDLRVEEP